MTPNPKSMREVKAMSDEELKECVAKLCGWQHELATQERPIVRHGMRLPPHFCSSRVAWWHPEVQGVYGEPTDYHRDLDAMHDAEEGLAWTPFDSRGLNQRGRFQLNLEQLLREEGIRREIWHATAKQRAIAFVLTLTESSAQRGEE